MTHNAPTLMALLFFKKPLKFYCYIIVGSRCDCYHYNYIRLYFMPYCFIFYYTGSIVIPLVHCIMSPILIQFIDFISK